jgi:hypothetical protein
MRSEYDICIAWHGMESEGPLRLSGIKTYHSPSRL